LTFVLTVYLEMRCPKTTYIDTLLLVNILSRKTKEPLLIESMVGIHGSEVNGAQSIVLSYKYEDDNDQGNIM
jgi:hypothetical protein